MAFQCVVKNFIAAKDVKFTVSGFTLIKGESSSGKSSSLKAIYAAMTNTFSPSQISWGEKNAEIKIRFENNGPILSVNRPRSGSPTMKLGEQEFSRMARAVPQEVEDFLNIGSVKSGAETVSLNFMSQFQPPLLHAFSHRRIADLISSSAALDDYNIAVKAVAARREQLKGSFNTVDSAMANLKLQIDEKSKKIIQQRDLAERLRGLQKDYLRLAERSERAEAVFKTAIFVSEKHVALRNKVTTLNALDKLSSAKENKDAIQLILSQLAESQRRSQLKDRKVHQLQILDRLLEASIRRGEAYSRVESIKSLGWRIQDRTKIEYRQVKLKSDLAVLTFVQTKLQALSECQTTRSRLEQLKIMVSQVKWTEARIEEKQRRLQDNVCPLCGAELNHE